MTHPFVNRHLCVTWLIRFIRRSFDWRMHYVTHLTMRHAWRMDQSCRTCDGWIRNESRGRWLMNESCHTYDDFKAVGEPTGGWLINESSHRWRMNKSCHTYDDLQGRWQTYTWLPNTWVMWYKHNEWVISHIHTWRPVTHDQGMSHVTHMTVD